MVERRQLPRKNFSHYMRVMNENTGELVGHLADISTGGFKLESSTPIPKNRDYFFRVDLSEEISNKPAMVFGARSKWCTKDRFDPMLYDVGFQIVNMTPGDFEIFARMFEKYGAQNANKSNSDYLWK